MYELQQKSETAVFTKGCPVCDGRMSDQVFDYINMVYESQKSKELFDPLKIYVCQNCGFGLSYPYLEDRALIDFYQNQYRSGEGSHALQLPHPSKDSKYGIRASAQWTLARMFLRDEGAKRILDIGTGAGDALLAAREIFPGAELYAVEADSSCWGTLEQSSINLYKMGFTPDTAKGIREKFDLVLFSHILEHYNARDLDKILTALKNLLTEEGVCVIEVPLTDLMQFHAERVYDAPHLSFFTVSALRQLLSKQFEIIFCRGCGPKYIDVALHMKAHHQKTRETIMYKSNSRLEYIKRTVKNILRRTPFLKNLVDVRKKLVEPTYYDLIKGAYYSYGEDRDFIRAVVRKK